MESKVILESKFGEIKDETLKSWLKDIWSNNDFKRANKGIEQLSDSHKPLGYISYNGDYRLIIPKVYDKEEAEDGKKLLPHAIKFYLALKKCREEMPKSKVFGIYPNPTDVNRKNLLTASRLEAELALIDFYRLHSDWIRTMVLHHHRGNKVNWSKTISRKQPLISKKDSRYNVIYHHTITNKKVVNFDDQLIVLFYSVLNLLKEEGHDVTPNYNFDLIPINVLQSQYIEKKHGVKLLNSIKHKYSDNTSLKLWDLLYNFFECCCTNNNNGKMSCLIVTNFQSVFEHMVDNLLSDEKIKDHRIAKFDDSRRLDHIWRFDDPIIEGHTCFYIADSKYYEDDVQSDKTALYKQFVYPRNLVENCMMIEATDFEKAKDFKEAKGFKSHVYDEKTRGYYVVPNCLIQSADVKNGEHFEESQNKDSKADKDDPLKDKKFFRYHHKGHLFDRDTRFLICLDIDLKYMIENYTNVTTYRSFGINVKKEIKKMIDARIKEFYKIEKSNKYEAFGKYDNTSFIHHNGNYWKATWKDPGANTQS